MELTKEQTKALWLISGLMFLILAALVLLILVTKNEGTKCMAEPISYAFKDIGFYGGFSNKTGDMYCTCHSLGGGTAVTISKLDGKITIKSGEFISYNPENFHAPLNLSYP